MWKTKLSISIPISHEEDPAPEEESKDIETNLGTVTGYLDQEEETFNTITNINIVKTGDVKVETEIRAGREAKVVKRNSPTIDPTTKETIAGLMKLLTFLMKKILKIVNLFF